MRIRIALAVAMAATFIISFAVSLNNHVGAKHHRAADYSLAAFHQNITHHAAGTTDDGQPLTTALLNADQQLFDTNLQATTTPAAATSTPATTAAAPATTTTAPAPTTTTPPPTAPAPTTTTTTAPPPPPPPPPPPTDATSTTTADWQCIRVHESGDQYNSPAAPSGAYGIIEETWRSFGYNGWPYESTAATQNALALKLYNEYGWQPWSTRYVCGL